MLHVDAMVGLYSQVHSSNNSIYIQGSLTLLSDVFQHIQTFWPPPSPWLNTDVMNYLSISIMNDRFPIDTTVFAINHVFYSLDYI